jgi:hypothetical protein
MDKDSYNVGSPFKSFSSYKFEDWEEQVCFHLNCYWATDGLDFVPKPSTYVAL